MAHLVEHTGVKALLQAGGDALSLRFAVETDANEQRANVGIRRGSSRVFLLMEGYFDGAYHPFAGGGVAVVMQSFQVGKHDGKFAVVFVGK
jgi:hypothetical protein